MQDERNLAAAITAYLDMGVRSSHGVNPLWVADVDADEETRAIFDAYPPAVVALGGAIVSVDHMGGVVVHRGLLREEQAKALRDQARQEEGGAGGNPDADTDESAKSGISVKLAKRLSAHRTAALQAEVARHPQVALVALVHRLALRVIVESYGAGDSALNISATPQDGLGLHAPDMADAPAAVGMRKVREAWAQRLPSDSDGLAAQINQMVMGRMLTARCGSQPAVQFHTGGEAVHRAPG